MDPARLLTQNLGALKSKVSSALESYEESCKFALINSNMP